MSAQEFVDYYELLEVSPKASRSTIERVFRFLAKQHHPDVSKDGDDAFFRQLIDAFDTLQDPQKRAAYDTTYVKAKGQQAALAEGANAAGDDTVERYKLLSLLYAKRRQDIKKPGIGLATMENMVSYPPEVVGFHLWYFIEKKWIAREQSGQYSITAAGVDHIDSMNKPRVDEQLLLEHQKTRIPAAATTARNTMQTA
ncbi:MAG: DnaJ domain-containing protein [Pirellulaceae bacterium]